MNLVRALSQPDTLQDLSTLIIKISNKLAYVGHNTVNIIKFLLCDVTISLRSLPFGNWVSLIYFVFMSTIIKDVISGGEINRILFRAIEVYFIQQKTNKECFARFQSYLWRIVVNWVSDLEYSICDWTAHIWSYIGGGIQTRVTKFTREIILENADEIEKTVVGISKTAAFSVVITALSQRLISEIGPVAFETFAKSNLAKSVTDIHQNTGNIDRILETVHSVKQDTDILQLRNGQIEFAIDRLVVSNEYARSLLESISNNLGESVSIIMDAERKGSVHLLEENALLNEKLVVLSTQLDYLRATQPTHFKEIVDAVSIAVNNVALPSGLPANMATFLSTFSGAFSSSASQQGRRRIESI